MLKFRVKNGKLHNFKQQDTKNLFKKSKKKKSLMAQAVGLYYKIYLFSFFTCLYIYLPKTKKRKNK